MRVEDFMTRRVVTITPDTTLLRRGQADAGTSCRRPAGAGPWSVRIIGIFSESDLPARGGEGRGRLAGLQMMVDRTGSLPSRAGSTREKSGEDRDAPADHHRIWRIDRPSLSPDA